MVDDGKSFWQGTSQWRFVLSHDGAVSRPGKKLGWKNRSLELCTAWISNVYSFVYPFSQLELTRSKFGCLHILTLNTYDLYAASSPSTLLQESSRYVWEAVDFCTVSLHMVVLCYVISTGYLRFFYAENANSFSELSKKGHHGRILDPICGWRELLRASCVLCFWETIEVDHWLCGTCRRIKLLQQCDRSYCNYLQLLISLAGLSDVAAGHW